MTSIAVNSWALWDYECDNTDDRNHSQVPNDEERGLVEEVHLCLQILDPPVSILQRNTALMAEYFPVTAAMRASMQEAHNGVTTQYLRELDCAEVRIALAPRPLSSPLSPSVPQGRKHAGTQAPRHAETQARGDASTRGTQARGDAGTR